MSNQIFVIKNSGQKESFSEEKVLRSMERVGIKEDLKPMVLEHIKQKLHPDIKTSEIFSHILEFVKYKDKKASIRLNLKKAIFDLGPTGFPFEKYIERIFKSMDYQTQVDLFLEGACVKHEIDLLIEKDGEKNIIEAKFHNTPGVKTDVHVALYTYARFQDVKDKNNINGVWIVTNTKLTEDAMKYANCKGIETIAWNYPENENLQYFVENPNMYPITILDSLSNEDKKQLLENNVILCSDLLDDKNQNVINSLFISKEKLEEAKRDTQIILKTQEVKVLA